MYKAESEEHLKTLVFNDYFKLCKESVMGFGKIDLAIKYCNKHIVWCEAKHKPNDLFKMFAQLIFTIYQHKREHKKPKYICVFDNEKIAFIQFSEIAPLFNANLYADFNWNVTPSNQNTKEFKIIQEIISGQKSLLEQQENIVDFSQRVFYFAKDKQKLKEWIAKHITSEDYAVADKINAGNFQEIYNEWCEEVKPYIAEDWEAVKGKYNILDCDFFLADLFSSEDDNHTIEEKLSVLLEDDRYRQKRDNIQVFNERTIFFKKNNGKEKHTQFWKKYERPPENIYWQIILNRRDLLVPLDVRERLGAFFTPPEWVKLSQQYMSDVWGNLDDYFIWDCAGGTGNLLEGLNNKYNLFISDINIENVYITQAKTTKNNDAMFLEEHCFQFDFLNDEFDKLPSQLKKIIDDPEKRKKLIIYINPPYAEATSTATKLGTKKNKTGVATVHYIHKKYSEQLGKARNELFALFLVRIYFEIPECKIGTFSTLKELVSPAFKSFRKFFLSQFKKGFIIPANTFDNVKGNFQIGFTIWDTKHDKHFQSATLDVFDRDRNFIGKKKYVDGLDCKYINDWIKNYKDNKNNFSAKLCFVGNDFQNQGKIHICSFEKEIIAHDVVFNISQNNLIIASIYFAVRKVIEGNWINHRDQFLYPNEKWKKDKEFQSDCLTYTLFHGKNLIQSQYGINHWIPFREHEVDAKSYFDSHFMTDFISGKIEISSNGNVFSPSKKINQPLQFSKEAQKVFDCGRELWKYYHQQVGENTFNRYDVEYNVNASLYDIRRAFQGEKNGRMNSKSNDERYNELLANLREALNKLGDEKIVPKVYEYGFLLE